MITSPTKLRHDKRHTELPPVNDIILYTAIKSARRERGYSCQRSDQ